MSTLTSRFDRIDTHLTAWMARHSIPLLILSA
jgi:hypothetical protein